MNPKAFIFLNFRSEDKEGGDGEGKPAALKWPWLKQSQFFIRPPPQVKGGRQKLGCVHRLQGYNFWPE